MNLQHSYHRIFLLIALPFWLTLTTFLPAAAQDTGKESLLAAFSRYQSQTPQEKLFVHIDRSFYLAGETIWFKLYDIDARSNRPVAFSGIAYIEVLDKDDHAVLQTKVELHNGKGDGAFSIPMSVPTGEFLFRAYTSWMRNFSPDLYYMQPLTIFNTLNDDAADTIQPPHPGDTAQSPHPADLAQPPHPVDPSHPRFRLFPEGGNLVNGLASLIAMETVDHEGKGTPCEGAIIDQRKDTVAHFHTSLSGIGKFTFTPMGNNTYFAITEVDHQTVTQPLPASYDQGYVMHLEDSGGRRIRIIVHAAGPIQNPAIYLFAHTRGQIKAVQMNFLSDGQTSFYLDKDSLGDGISHLTVFNSDRLPVCERLYFKQPKQQMHIAITNVSSNYPTRSPVSIGLSATDNAGNPLIADLSMSVFRLDSLQPVPGPNILDWLLLSSDLTNTPNPTASSSLDDLMLTRGWSRFRWEDILKDHQPAFEFLPEVNGMVVGAKVIDKRTGQAPVPVLGYLSVPGQHFKLATALSQSDGSLYFYLGNVYGNRTLIAQTNSRTDSNCRLDVLSPWSERFASFPLPSIEYSNGWADQLLRRTIDAQAENAYLTARKHHYSQVVEDTVAFYGTADLKYNLDDYVRFVTMDEVIQEFVDNVRIRSKSGHAYFRVKNALFNLFFEDDPLLLIDGIPVFDASKLVETDPAKIERIEVVSHRYVLGPSVTDGVVSFRSYDGEFAGYEVDPNAIAIQYNGLDRHREFYTPVYDAGTRGLPSIPDFRSELLWAPNVIVDATGKTTLPLYTSDLTGKFALVVEGITKDGLAGYSIVTFSVGQ
jgi:hypothetical protein